MARVRRGIFECETEARHHLCIDDRGTDPGRPAIKVVWIFEVELARNSRGRAPVPDNTVTAADKSIAQEGGLIDGTSNSTDTAHSSNAAYTPDATDTAHSTHASDATYTPDATNPTEGSNPC